jgi:hypothetical protein
MTGRRQEFVYYACILLLDKPKVTRSDPKIKVTVIQSEIRTGVREGWSGVREDRWCLGLTFI